MKPRRLATQHVCSKRSHSDGHLAAPPLTDSPAQHAASARIGAPAAGAEPPCRAAASSRLRRQCRRHRILRRRARLHLHVLAWVEGVLLAVGICVDSQPCRRAAMSNMPACDQRNAELRLRRGWMAGWKV